MNESRKLSPLGHLLAWLPAAAVAVAILWSDSGPVAGLCALAGPWSSVWAFPADRWSMERIAFLLVTTLPLILGFALLIKYRDRPGGLIRIFVVAGLSLYWHGLSVLILILVTIAYST